MDREVVITGYGVISPLGIGNEENKNAILNGNSGIKPITLFDTGGLNLSMGGEIQGFSPRKFFKNRSNVKYTNRSSRFSLAAAASAKENARLGEADYDPENTGIYIGSGETGMEATDFFPALDVSYDHEKKEIDFKKYGEVGLVELDPFIGLTSLPNNGLCFLSIEHNIRGQNNNYIKSSVASSEAIGMAFKSIKWGYADVIFAGGYDSLINFFVYLAYEKAGLLPENGDEIYRVYDRDWNGLILGEGAGIIILEELAHARQRGAPIHAKITGFAEANEAYDLIKFPAEPGGMIYAIEQALQEANAGKDEIDFISPQAMGLRDGDIYEAKAIQTVFGELSARIPVTTFTPLTGFMGAASGVIDLIYTLFLVEERKVLPIPNLDISRRREECELNLVTQPMDKDIKRFLNLNYAIGGSSTCLVVEKYEQK